MIDPLSFLSLSALIDCAVATDVIAAAAAAATGIAAAGIAAAVGGYRCWYWVGRLDEVHPSWSSLASRPQDSPLSATGVQQAR